MKDTKIIFFGTPEFACSILKALIQEKYNVVAVVSQPDKPVGRKRVIMPTPVHKLADEYGIPVIQPDRLSEAKNEIFSYEPELIITCAYGQFVPTSILKFPKYGCINVHPSLLPRFRGGAPIHHAIWAGDKETGVSIMEMVKTMDAGKVFAQCRIPIGPDETMMELNERLIVASVDLLMDTLPRYLAGELSGVEQDPNLVVIGANISKDEEQVHFEVENIDEVYNHIRALYNWPVAYGMIAGKRIKFLKARKSYEFVEETPGTVIGFKNGAMEVACKEGILYIYELQPEGKNKMDAVAFANGAGKNLIGQKFE